MRRSRRRNPWPRSNPAAEASPASHLRALRNRHVRARDGRLHEVGARVAHDHGLRARPDVTHDEAALPSTTWPSTVLPPTLTVIAPAGFGAPRALTRMSTATRARFTSVRTRTWGTV